MFFGAHPDDIDVFFGGLIARLIKDGKEVHCVVVTSGARGSRENTIPLEKLSKEREAEETAALSKLGVAEDKISYLGIMDGEVETDHETIGKFVYEIRKFQPDIVCAHSPHPHVYKLDNSEFYHVQHRDHRHVGQNVIDAVYPMSRDTSFHPQHLEEGLSTVCVQFLYLTGEGEHNTEVDITDVLDMKKAAMKEHVSQFSDEKIDYILNFNKVESGYSETGMFYPLSS